MPCGQQSSHQRSSCGPGSCRATLLLFAVQLCYMLVLHAIELCYMHSAVQLCYVAIQLCCMQNAVQLCCFAVQPCYVHTVLHPTVLRAHCPISGVQCSAVGGRAHCRNTFWAAQQYIWMGAANANAANNPIASDCMLFIKIQHCH